MPAVPTMELIQSLQEVVSLLLDFTLALATAPDTVRPRHFHSDSPLRPRQARHRQELFELSQIATL